MSTGSAAVPPGAERQEAPGDGGATLGGGVHHAGEPADGGRVIGAARDQADAARDGLEDVVEVVGDAPGELAEGRQLLGLVEPGLDRLTGDHLLLHPHLQLLVQAVELGLRLPERGHVGDALHDGSGAAAGVPAQRFADGNGDLRPILAPMLEVAGPFAVAQERRLDFGEADREHCLQEPVRVAPYRLGTGPSVESFAASRPEADRAVEVADEHGRQIEGR